MLSDVKISVEKTFSASTQNKDSITGHNYRVGIAINAITDSCFDDVVKSDDIDTLFIPMNNILLNRKFKVPSVTNLAKYFALKVMRLKENITDVTVSVYETDTYCSTITVSRKRLYQ